MSDELWWSGYVGLLPPDLRPDVTEVSQAVADSALHQRLRDSCKDAPLHIRRSIDECRVAFGRLPLWGLNKDEPGKFFQKSRQRRLNRLAQQRCRDRKKKEKEATDGRRLD